MKLCHCLPYVTPFPHNQCCFMKDKSRHDLPTSEAVYTTQHWLWGEGRHQYHNFWVWQRFLQLIVWKNENLFVSENNIKNEIKLVALAKERRDSGDRHLFDFLNMKKRDREELVNDAWRFENAPQILEDENVNIMVLLREKISCVCATVCGSGAQEIFWLKTKLILKNLRAHSEVA